MFLVFLFIFHSVQTEQLWSVQFPGKHLYLPEIETLFPLIDLLEHHASAGVFIVPDQDRRNFTRFILRSHGTYRILSQDTRHLLKLSRTRNKRWIPSSDPLDETYYQHFLSYDEQEDWYQLLNNSPSTNSSVLLHTIGTTHENRRLTVVHIRGTNHHSPRRKQRRRRAVFIDAGMHAREWISIGAANYLISRLLRFKDDNSTKVRKILRYFDLFVLPMMNPDGYEYSRQHNRLWRKNRAPTTHSEFWNGNPACYGIDLNRNFPYQWNSTYGASVPACAHSYRGPSPASEKEVVSVVNFLRDNRQSTHKFYAYFNLHSYGKFWLLPWTFTQAKQVPHYSSLFQRSSRIASRVMNGTYRVGQASLLLYPCSGTSIDFASTFMSHAMTFELPPVFANLPMCFEQNKTVDATCTTGFITEPRNIERDGKEIFEAIVEYLSSVIEDRFV